MRRRDHARPLADEADRRRSGGTGGAGAGGSELGRVRRRHPEPWACHDRWTRHDHGYRGPDARRRQRLARANVRLHLAQLARGRCRHSRWAPDPGERGRERRSLLGPTGRRRKLRRRHPIRVSPPRGRPDRRRRDGAVADGAGCRCSSLLPGLDRVRAGRGWRGRGGRGGSPGGVRPSPAAGEAGLRGDPDLVRGSRAAAADPRVRVTLRRPRGPDAVRRGAEASRSWQSLGLPQLLEGRGGRGAQRRADRSEPRACLEDPRASHGGLLPAARRSARPRPGRCHGDQPQRRRLGGPRHRYLGDRSRIGIRARVGPAVGRVHGAVRARRGAAHLQRRYRSRARARDLWAGQVRAPRCAEVPGRGPQVG